MSRKTLRIVSLTAMAIGVVLLGASAWLFAGRYALTEFQQHQLTEKLSENDNHGASISASKLVADPKPGEYFAIMEIPKLGESWRRGISEGTSEGNLNRLGVGHYEGTPFPDEPGNFAVAGHSGNHWTPFAQLDRIAVGDHIYVQTIDSKLEYVVRDLDVVPPEQIEVIKKVPKVSGAMNSANWITLTTCKEVDGKSMRLVVYGQRI